MSITTITSGIKTRIAAQLSTWTELDYVIDIEKNKYKRQDKRYGVKAMGGSQVPGVVQAITIDQRWQVTLVHSYASSTKDDNDKVLKTLLLQDVIGQLYNDFYSHLCGVTDVIHVYDLSISEPEYDDEEKVVLINFDFQVKYKNNL